MPRALYGTANVNAGALCARCTQCNAASDKSTCQASANILAGSTTFAQLSHVVEGRNRNTIVLLADDRLTTAASVFIIMAPHYKPSAGAQLAGFLIYLSTQPLACRGSQLLFLSLLHSATATWHPSTLAGEGPASLDLLRNVTASVQISRVTVGSSADVLAVPPCRFVTLSNVSTGKLSEGQSSDVTAKASRQVCQKSPSVCPLVPYAPPHHARQGDRYAIRCPGHRTECCGGVWGAQAVVSKRQCPTSGSHPNQTMPRTRAQQPQAPSAATVFTCLLSACMWCSRRGLRCQTVAVRTCLRTSFWPPGAPGS